MILASSHVLILHRKRGRGRVLNALQKTQHISHFTLPEAIEVAQESGVPQTFFTHISHKLGLHDEVSKELPEGVKLAYDGLKIQI